MRHRPVRACGRCCSCRRRTRARSPRRATAGADLVVLDLEDAVKPRGQGGGARCGGRGGGRRLADAGRDPRQRRRQPNGTRSTSTRSRDRRPISWSCRARSRRISSAASREAVGKPVLAMIETAAGVLAAAEIAHECAGADRRHQRSCAPTCACRSTPAREPISAVAAADRACRRAPPGLRCSTACSTGSTMPTASSREAEEGRRLGFDGKSLIHPNQIEPCHRAFAPSEAEIERARRAGRGVQRRRRALRRRDDRAHARRGGAAAAGAGGALAARLANRAASCHGPIWPNLNDASDIPLGPDVRRRPAAAARILASCRARPTPAPS